MMGVFGIISILAFHFIADFLLQSRQMANNKSTSIKELSKHVLVYAMASTVLYIIVSMDPMSIGYFFLITFATHWITDYFTSKWFSSLWAKDKEWKAIAIVGLDQFIHVSTLLLTYEYLMT